MKNIYVLSTDTPSRVSDCHNNKLHLDDVRYLRNYLNIYITNDESLKRGDWFYFNCEGIEDVIKVKSKFHLDKIKNHTDNKKVILTTDPLLIESGVQAIDDEFLEWFVKNPSCEFVEISTLNKGYNNSEDFLYQECYNIVIPQKSKQIKCYCGHTTYCNCIPIEKEKSYWKLVDEKAKQNNTIDLDAYANGVEDGVNWQAEQLFKDDVIETLNKAIEYLIKKQSTLYNEEDIRNAFFAGINSTGEGRNGEYWDTDMKGIEEAFEENFQEWFNEFKKK